MIELDAVDFVHVEVVVAVEPVVQENSRFHLWLLPIGLIGDSGVGLL